MALFVDVSLRIPIQVKHLYQGIIQNLVPDPDQNPGPDPV